MKYYLLLAFTSILYLVACQDNPSPPTTSSSGAAQYHKNCAICHGEDGKRGFSGAKDLSTSAMSKEEVEQIVNTGKGNMIAYKDILSKADIAAVSNYVLTLRKGDKE